MRKENSQGYEWNIFKANWVHIRWLEIYDSLLSVVDDKEARIFTVMVVNVLVKKENNRCEVSFEEIYQTFKEVQTWKDFCVDECRVLFKERYSDCVKIVSRMYNVYVEVSRMLEVRVSICIVQLCKEKHDKYDARYSEKSVEEFLKIELGL